MYVGRGWLVCVCHFGPSQQILQGCDLVVLRMYLHMPRAAVVECMAILFALP